MIECFHKLNFQLAKELEFDVFDQQGMGRERAGPHGLVAAADYRTFEINLTGAQDMFFAACVGLMDNVHQMDLGQQDIGTKIFNFPNGTYAMAALQSLINSTRPDVQNTFSTYIIEERMFLLVWKDIIAKELEVEIASALALVHNQNRPVCEAFGVVVEILGARSLLEC